MARAEEEACGEDRNTTDRHNKLPPACQAKLAFKQVKRTTIVDLNGQVGRIQQELEGSYYDWDPLVLTAEHDITATRKRFPAQRIDAEVNRRTCKTSANTFIAEMEKHEADQRTSAQEVNSITQLVKRDPKRAWAHGCQYEREGFARWHQRAEEHACCIGASASQLGHRSGAAHETAQKKRGYAADVETQLMASIVSEENVKPDDVTITNSIARLPNTESAGAVMDRSIGRKVGNIIAGLAEHRHL